MVPQPTNRYRLKLTSLKFISAVDAPAQETATALLFKHAGGEPRITATARVAKLHDELGLVFGWALTTTSKGSEYFDLHGDNILEEDLVKVAADFLAAGGATDAMHDDAADGRVVFAMPLTAEVAKAFGIETETTGLMVAIKPSADVFAKFKSGEFTGFSIAGQGERTLIKARDPLAIAVKLNGIEPADRGAVSVAKKQTLLAAAMGHTHLIDDLGGAESGYTSGESMPPAPLLGVATGAVMVDSYGSYHTHPWSRTGKVITIGMAANHTHDFPTTIDKSSADDAGNSTRLALTPQPVVMTQPQLDAKDQRIAELESQLGVATQKASLTDAQRAHVGRMTADDAQVFLAKSAGERHVEVEKANEVVYTSTTDGTVFRKSHDPMLVSMAKRLDAATDKAELVELTKRATATLGNLAGSDETHVALLKAAESIVDPVARTAAIDTLKAANAAMKAAGVIKGAGGIDEPTNTTLDGQFQALVQKHATDHKCDERDARLAVVKTDAGRALYNQIEADKKRPRA